MNTGVGIVRTQAEAAAAEYFATVVEGGASHVACETPSADSAGVVFYCFGVNSGGAPVVAQATINDYGTAELAAVASSATATTAPTTTTSPVISSAQGSGSQVVQVDPISGPTIVAVTHDGGGAFAVQPQQGGVPSGAPFASVTGAWSGRYLVGLGGTISGFAITADGDWTLTVQQRSSALAFDDATGVSGENADVVAYDDTAPWAATVVLRRIWADRRGRRHRVGCAGARQPGRPVHRRHRGARRPRLRHRRSAGELVAATVGTSRRRRRHRPASTTCCANRASGRAAPGEASLRGA